MNLDALAAIGLASMVLVGCGCDESAIVRDFSASPEKYVEQLRSAPGTDRYRVRSVCDSGFAGSSHTIFVVHDADGVVARYLAGTLSREDVPQSTRNMTPFNDCRVWIVFADPQRSMLVLASSC